MSELVEAMFEEYHDSLIKCASEKIRRPLTDKEMDGIRRIKSFLMLEALDMTIMYGTAEAIQNDLLFHSQYDWITGEPLQ